MPRGPFRLRRIFIACGALASACNSGERLDPVAATGKDPAPVAASAVTVLMVHSEIANGRVAVALRLADTTRQISAVQAEVEFAAAGLSYEGLQLPDHPRGLAVAHQAEPGRLRVAVLAPAGLERDAIVVIFSVHDPAALASMRVVQGSTIGFTANRVRLPMVPREAVQLDPTLRVGLPENLTASAWFVRLGLSAGSSARTAASVAGDLVYGDVDLSGGIDLLDALEIANTSVGARPSLTGDTLEVANVAPANTADGVEAAFPDPCRPGRVCAPTAPYGELAPGVVDLLDALAVAQRSVGEVPPVVGLPVPRPPAFLHLVAGAYHTCGLTAAGQAYCWGYNGEGGLGDGTDVERPKPVGVRQPSGVAFSALAAGVRHTCGRTPAGQAYCWGGNQSGALGDGGLTRRLTPVAVLQPGGVAFSTLIAASFHTCGSTAAGQAYCWGDNFAGQLGDGSFVIRRTPVMVSQPSVTMGSLAAGNVHTCGLAGAGQAYCWGSSYYGQLGDGGPNAPDRLTPVPTTQSSGLAFSAITGGYYHTCGRSAGGQAYCWGSNFFGQLGDNSVDDRRTPVIVSLPVGLSALSAGYGHTCGLTTAGQVYCWGANEFGQLGDSTTNQRLVPGMVHMPMGVTFSEITSGLYHTCGLTATGQAYCWGRNENGQLGDNSRTERHAPVAVMF